MTIPVSQITMSTVAAIVNPDGTEEIVRVCYPSSNGLVIPLEHSAAIRIFENKKVFYDVSAGQEAIEFVTSRELFQGVGGHTFAPNMPVTQAMMLTALYRLVGEPPTVETDVWYGLAAQWALDTGLIEAVDAGQVLSVQNIIDLLSKFSGREISINIDGPANRERAAYIILKLFV